MKSRTTVLLSGLGFLLAAAAVAPTVTFDMVLELVTKAGLFNPSIHPTLERAEANEPESIKNIASDMFAIQMALQPQSRDAHAKGHGCAQAEFTIESKIPVDFQVGIFAQPEKSFPAIIRYSNGAGKTQADAVPDARGMVVKVIGAVPSGNLLDTGTTQDFMMIDSPEFFIRSIGDYANFIHTQRMNNGDATKFFLDRAIREALTEAGIPNAEEIPETDIQKIVGAASALENGAIQLGDTLQKLFPQQVEKLSTIVQSKLTSLSLKQAPLELQNIQKMSRPIGSSLTESYFSMSSYLLKAKSGDTAVKYVTRPVDCATGEKLSPKPAPVNPTDTDYLRKDLADTLAAHAVCFELYLQPLPVNVTDDARRTLVEDSRLDYDTAEIPVAHLVLPVQTVDTPARQQYCENLSYNPWQTGPEHRPLGGMNRARRVAVTASSIRRHLYTGNQRLEPVSIQEFENLPKN